MNHRALLPVACLSLFASVGTQSDGRAKLTVEAKPTKAWVGQTFVVSTRIDVDADFFEKNVIQILRRKLDLPVQIDARWMREIDGARVTAPSTPVDSTGVSLAAGGTLVFGRRLTPRGSYSIEHRFRADRPGRLDFAAPTLRYAWTSGFESDFLGDPKPIDRRLGRAQGNAVEVVVRALPVDGRPESFGGAVGSFRLRAAAGPRDTTIPFTLTIEGDGDFERITPPTAGAMRGLHVRSQRVTRSATKLEWQAELVVTDEQRAFVPRIEFSWFDPVEARYVTKSTDRIWIAGAETPDPSATLDDSGKNARPSTRDAGAELETEIRDALRELDLEVGRQPAPPLRSTWFWAVALLSPWFGALGFALWKYGERVRAEARHGEAALARRVMTDGRRDDRSLESDYVAYLAKITGRSIPATVDGDLADALENAGVPADVAKRSRDCLRELVGARYGGENTGNLQERVVRVVSEIEASRRGRTR